MFTSHIAVVLIMTSLGISTARAADHDAHTSTPSISVSTLNTDPKAAPRLTVFAPRADFLEKGIIYIPFSVKNMILSPLYAEVHGEAVTATKPKIGHLHVQVGNNKWAWVHAHQDPIYFSTLPAGTHLVTVELADAAHNVIEKKILTLEVPEQD
ncbi:DUF6130 family protein [Pseudomonas putida]|uniref:DUF6130 family protein n=1 Tax=Pseudomonas putida TaxID=303 RepID=UPI00383AD94C